MTGTRLDGTDRSSVKFVMPKRCACLRTPESPKLNQTRQNRMASARLEFVRTVIDLDVAVREIERRADGFTVEPVTWRDQTRRMAAEPEHRSRGCCRSRLDWNQGPLGRSGRLGCSLRRWLVRCGVLAGQRILRAVDGGAGGPNSLTIEDFGRLLDSLIDRFY
jgi:hypothetical protein